MYFLLSQSLNETLPSSYQQEAHPFIQQGFLGTYYEQAALTTS